MDSILSILFKYMYVCNFFFNVRSAPHEGPGECLLSLTDDLCMASSANKVLANSSTEVRSGVEELKSTGEDKISTLSLCFLCQRQRRKMRFFLYLLHVRWEHIKQEFRQDAALFTDTMTVWMELIITCVCVILAFGGDEEGGRRVRERERVLKSDLRRWDKESLLLTGENDVRKTEAQEAGVGFFSK